MKYKDVEGILYNYKIIAQRIVVLENEIAKMTEDSISFQSDMDGMPKSTSPGNPTERMALKLSIEKDLKLKRIKKDKETLDKINQAFHVLTVSERNIINARYLEGKTWAQVAKEAGYSISHTKRMRKSAIEQMIMVLN